MDKLKIRALKQDLSKNIDVYLTLGENRYVHNIDTQEYNEGEYIPATYDIDTTAAKRAGLIDC